ncbi:MAG: hypothetical protein ACOZAM_28495 [Pseudomonadota bacterium]
MKLVALMLATLCPTTLPQLRMMTEAALNDLRLARVAAVTVGEIAADCLSLNLGSGLLATAWALGALLAAALFLQLTQGRQAPRAHRMAAACASVAAALLSPAFWSTDRS